jgi:RNA polymerase sigma factor (sigma-70 family)
MDKRSDYDLLNDFAANAGETAFATLVDRHIGLVYSAAFRQLNDAHLAEDVTQAVFVLLARKAPTISKGTILAGWLYRTARYVSRDVLKTEARRRKREQDAAEAHSSVPVNEGKWEGSAARLDNALSQLTEKDRSAVLLRYFEAKTLREVGEALGCTEEAARKRLDRAVEKLRGYLEEKNGVTPALGIEELFRNGRSDLPGGAVIRATTAALADGVAMSANVLPLVKSALQFMFLTKLKHILPALAAAALISTVLLIASRFPEQKEIPTAGQIISRHLAASGTELLNVQRNEPVGTACMSCHRPDRSSGERLCREVNARGEWQDPQRGLKGSFEVRISGPDRTVEEINIAGIGSFVRGRNERTSWSITPDGPVRVLAQLEAEQFERETAFLIWPGATNATDSSRVELTSFGERKSYCIPENGDRLGTANYFDVESGFRIGSTWKSAGSSTGQANFFEKYQSFDTIMFPARIIRRRIGSEEVFTVTNLTIADAPLRVFKPPRGPH